MNAFSNCPNCGAEIPPDSPANICPRCLLATGLESDADSVVGAHVTTPHSGSGRRFVPPTPAELADRFPQLEILGLVGAGGMGAVYKARQRELDRVVALKILPPQLGEDPAFAERFAREARAMARLSHPNIVGIYDFGRRGDLFYFVMEYVDGTNLRQLIKTGPVDASQALAITSQICDALQYAHDEGVIHRDIKPENVLIDKTGRVRIGDFGLAKVVLDAAHEVSLTGTAELLGTFRYMAPEQLEKSGKIDHRADIYALGIVLYELLTGEVPMGRFYPPSEKTKSDPRLDAVVLRALEREPDRRFQQASDVKTALESIDAAASMAGGLSTFTSRWASGMFSGIWPATSLRPSGGMVVGCRILGMLVALAGVLTACFLPWQRIQINVANGAQIANQTLLGWQIWHGKLTALVLALVALHILAHLHRLRYLAPTYGVFLVAGFTTVGLGFWQFQSPARVIDAPIRWESGGVWQGALDLNAESVDGGVDGSGPELTDNKSSSEGLRGKLEALIPSETLPNGTGAHGLTNQQLFAILADRGDVTLSSYEDEGPLSAIMLGIGIAFVGLLEFIFTFSADPVRRLFGSARSSVALRRSDSGMLVEPRISKMAVASALLGLLPIIPLVFLGMMAVEVMRRGYADGEPVTVAISFLIGLAIFPTTVGLFAMYRIRRSRGLLHGLPLAFAASITWPLVIADVIVTSVGMAVTSGGSQAQVSAALTVALICNVLAYVFGWGAVKRPL